MPFDWIQEFKGALAGWKQRLQRAGIDSTYAMVAATALWPVAAAAQAGDWTALVALGGMLGGNVGANLVASHLQNWKDEVDGARQLAALPKDDPLRPHLDAVLERLDAFSQARAALTESDREWFVRTLRTELVQLGNWSRFEAQIVAAGERSVAIDSQVTDSVITTGDVLNTGAGAVATHGSAAAGQGGIAVAGSVHGNIIVNPASGQATNPTERGRVTYLKNLRRQCEILPLSALGEEEGIEAGVTLDDVYVALDTKTSAPVTTCEKEEPSPSHIAHESESDQRPLSAMEAVQQSRRLVLLGDPGAGKSTFANQVLARLASHQLDPQKALPSGLPGDLLPILIVLRELAPRLAPLMVDALPADQAREAFCGAIRAQAEANLARLEAQEFAEGLRAVLREGRFLLVLDGLDEVPYALLKRVRQAVVALLAAWSPERVIVTCRLRSYEGEARLPQFDAHTLAPFDEQKIEGFVDAWYRTQKALGRVDAEQEQRKADDLKQAALSKNLRELASNPMLLTTMALIHQREIQLPSQRVQLYSLAVDVLVRRWQKGKTGDLAGFLQDNLRLRSALERLAYEAHRSGNDPQHATDLPRGTALTVLEQPEFLGQAGLAAEFLDYVDQRAGLLVGRGGGPGQPQVYSFPHRTFQEYLAGCHLLSGRDSGQQARDFFRHAAEGDYWRVAARLAMEELRYNIPRGTHALLDLAYRLCPGDEPKNAQGRRAHLWAGNMAALAGRETIERDVDSPDGGPRFIQRLLPSLVSLLDSGLTAPEREEAAQMLAALGDPRPSVAPSSLDEMEATEFCYVPPGSFVMGEGNERRVIESLSRGYWVGRYPVTVAQYRLFIEVGGYREPSFWTEAEKEGFWEEGSFQGRSDSQRREGPAKYGFPFNLANHPVVGISWYEALAYCRWLDTYWRHCLPKGFSFTLPSEVEWEKAARGGKEIPREGIVRRLADGLAEPGIGEFIPNPSPERIYPWGNDFDANRTNCSESRLDTTSAPGSFAQGSSPYGIMELSGNVWEWTRNLWEGGEDLTADAESYRVLRGGAFGSKRGRVHCAYRGRHYPGYRIIRIGFRVVVSPFSSLKHRRSS